MSTVTKKKTNARSHKLLSSKRRILVFYLFLALMGFGLTYFSSADHFVLFDLFKPASVDPVSVTPSPKPTNNPSASETPKPTNTPTVTPGVTKEPTPTPTKAPTPTPTLSPTPSPSPTPKIPNDLLKNAYPEVNQLVETYYGAKLSGLMSDFENVVNDTSQLDIDAIQQQYEYIKSFSNFNCYTKRGIGSIEYVVYVSYDSEVATIVTPIPSLDRLLVIRDAKTNSLRICLSSTATRTNEYLEEIQNDKDVQDLLARVSEAFRKALESDKDLSSFYQKLSQ